MLSPRDVSLHARTGVQVSQTNSPEGACSSVKHALYRYFDTEGRLLYVGVTQDMRQRESFHRVMAEWFPSYASRSVEYYECRNHALALEAVAIRYENPLFNVRPADLVTEYAALKRWLKSNGESQNDFAIRLGISPARVSELCNGRSLPDLDTAKLIESLTDGGVPVSSWPLFTRKEASQPDRLSTPEGSARPSEEGDAA